MAFVPRARFAFPTGAAPSWMPGHMTRGLRLIEERLASIDLIVEARDARLPLTSINPLFEGFASGSRKRISQKSRVVVYCKRDLADARLERPLADAFSRQAGYPVAFVDTRVDGDVRTMLRMAVEHAHAAAEGAAICERPVRMLIVGLPNTGKSSLLNAMRRVGTRKGASGICSL